MHTKSWFFLANLLLVMNISAQQYNEDLHIHVWDNQTAPCSNNLTGPETQYNNNKTFAGNTTSAELYFYLPKNNNHTQQAVVICPGGGYSFNSMENEGRLMAEWFAQQGVVAAVLKYRLPNEIPAVPYDDALEALRIVREQATQLGFDSTKVGIVGASAGGHLAAMTSTFAPQSKGPNFTILFYPVISADISRRHAGTFRQLLGTNPTQELFNSYSIEKCVTENTPPALLIHCADDKAVPFGNSVAYHDALLKKGVKSMLLIMPEGGHGWGLYPHAPMQSVWKPAIIEWLKTI